MNNKIFIILQLILRLAFNIFIKYKTIEMDLLIFTTYLKYDTLKTIVIRNYNSVQYITFLTSRFVKSSL